jgi:hypothetical protein
VRNENTTREAPVLNEEEVFTLLAWVGVHKKEIVYLEINPGRVHAVTGEYSYDFDLEDTWDPYMEYDFPWRLERNSLVKNT